LLDKDPAVSPDGNTVVWTKCQTDSTGCVIWEARRTADGWSSNPLTSPAEDAGLADTDGNYVVYAINPGPEADVAWQPVGGGAEQDLALAGEQDNPNISNGVITYEQLDWSTEVPNFDVWLYDIAPNTLYRLTNDPEDETLNDVSVNADRQVTVAWTKSEADDNVYAEWFTLPPLAAADTTPPTVSVDGFADGDSFTVGAPRPVATCSSSDDGSGVATTSGPTEQDNLDANGVGTVSVTCSATDNAGNTASATSTYSIGYALSGFDGLQTTGHAGRTIPVQWQLGDGNGGFVSTLSAVSSITYRTASCDGFAATGAPVAAATAGRSGLRYDARANAYVFTWKTPRTSGCYVLSVTLDSGQELQADVTLS
jgi:hypothetical protein